jgi:hypothetical protein
MPPQYKADPYQVRKFRFSNADSTAPTIFAVTRFSLAMIYGFDYIDQVPARRFISAFSSVRLDRVQVWIQTGNGVGGGSANLISFAGLTWKSENSPDTEINSAGNQLNPGYISSRPPEGSLAHFWTGPLNVGDSSGSDVLFTISVPVNSQIVVDVSVMYVPTSSGTEMSFMPLTTGADHFSYRALDDNGTSLGGLLPVGNVP